jgi:hypothetical protein
MCRAARCATCGRTTWAGCGKHVRQVMATVPEAQQCTCPGRAVAADPASAGLGGRLRRLLARR